MANAIIIRANYYMHNKAFHIFVMFNVFFLVQKSGAFEFTVGGSKGWTVPSDPNTPIYNKWAEATRFQVEDSILFSYEANKDSVLRVTKEDYDNCNTSNPLQKNSDGHSVFQLSKSGPHYFISGVKENCQKNEKIVVVVLADRREQSSMASPPSPMAIISSISALLVSSSLFLI